MYDIVGYLAAAFLMFAALPQAIKVVRQGHADGMIPIYLIMLLIGFILMLIFVIEVNPKIQLILNYSFNIVLYLIISYYKIFPRRLK